MRRWVQSWPAVLAVVVTSAAVAVVAIIGAQRDDTAAPAPLAEAPAAGCLGPLPPAWLTQDPPSGVPRTVLPISLLPDGGFLYVVNYDRSDQPSSVMRYDHGKISALVQLPADGSRPGVTTDGTWLVVAIYPFVGGTFNSHGYVSSVLLLNLHTGARTVVTRAAAAPNWIDSAVLFGGNVYWEVHVPHYNKATVMRYSLTDHTTTPAFHTYGTGLSVSAGGLYALGGSSALVAAPLPDAVSDAVGARPQTDLLTTDGTDYVWLAGDSLEYWAPATGARRVAVPREVDLDPTRTFIAVAGPYVFVNRHVIDVRTDITARLVDPSWVYDTRGTTALLEGRGSISAPPYVNDLASLPRLTC